MILIIAQGLPTLWQALLILAYAWGIPLCALLAVFLCVAPPTFFDLRTWIPTFVVALLPISILVCWETTAQTRAFSHQTVWDDAKNHWAIWTFAVVALVGPTLASIFRKIRVVESA